MKRTGAAVPSASWSSTNGSGWTLLVSGSCQHLQPNGDCGIYETRPNICREHSNDYCEYDTTAEEGFELYFQTYEDLLKYCRKRFKRWD